MKYIIYLIIQGIVVALLFPIYCLNILINIVSEHIGILSTYMNKVIFNYVYGRLYDELSAIKPTELTFNRGTRRWRKQISECRKNYNSKRFRIIKSRMLSKAPNGFNFRSRNHLTWHKNFRLMKYVLSSGRK